MNVVLPATVVLLPAVVLLAWWWWRPRPIDRTRAKLYPRTLMGEDARTLYQRLRGALPQYVILVRANLASFIEARGQEPGLVRRRHQMLAEYTIDFVICSNDFRVVAAVELEDVLAGNPGEAARSALLREAGIPLLRWTTLNLPTARDIQEAVAELETLRVLHMGLEDQLSAFEHTPAEFLSGHGRQEPRL